MEYVNLFGLGVIIGAGGLVGMALVELAGAGVKKLIERYVHIG